MREILLIDTSVYLILLQMPDVDHDDPRVRERVEAMQDDTVLLLPMAAIWETGNHVSRLADGGLRYQHARALVDDVEKAFAGEVPYTPTFHPDRDVFLEWLRRFPYLVKANKSVTKQGEGPSLADVSIIQEWERTCALHRGSAVEIWSLDEDLAGYQREGWAPGR